MTDERTETTEATSSRGAGWQRRVALGVLGLVAVSLLLVVGGLVWLRSPWGNDFVRDQIVQRLGEATIGEVRLESVSGDPLSGITLHGFSLIGPDGVPLVTAERVRVSYALQPFFDKRIIIDEVHLLSPEIHLTRALDGRWNFQTIWKPRPEKPPTAEPGWGSVVRIDELVIENGSVDVRLAEGRWPVLRWDENRFADLEATMSLDLLTRDTNRRTFAIEEASFRVTAPALDVRRLSGIGVFTPDSLALREIVFETPGTTVGAEGLVSFGPEADSLAIAVDAPRVSMEETKRFFPAVRLDGTGSFRGRLTGPAGNPTLIVERGTVDTGRSELAAEGRIETIATPRLDLSARVSPLAPADVRLFVDAYPLAQPVSGEVRLDGPPTRLDVDADLTAAAGRFSVNGSIDFAGAVPAYDLSATSRSLDVGALIGEPAIDLTLTGSYGFRGRGFGERDLDARATAELGPSSIYRWNVLAGVTRGRLVGRRYVADTVWIRMPQTTLRGEGTFGLAANGVVEADMDLASEDLGEVWPGLGDWASGARADLRIDGTYQGFEAIGDVVAAGVDVQGVTADSFSGTVRMTGVGSEAVRMEADGTFRTLRVAGMVADTAGVRLAYSDGRMSIDGDFDLTGEAFATLAATADFTGPETRLELTRFLYRGEQTWRMEKGGSLALVGDRIVADSLEIVQDGQTLRLDGTFALEGRSDLRFAADNVSLKDVARLLGQPPGDWQGRANVEGTLHGTRAAPILEVRGRVTEGMIRGFRFQRIEGQFAYEDLVAEVDLTVTTPVEGHHLVATGRLPIDLSLVGGVDRLPERPVDLVIRGENTDLSLLAAVVPGLRDLSGPVNLRVEITGTSQNPRFEGVATIADGAMTIPASGVRYGGIQGTVRFNNDRIVVEEIRGTDRERGTFEIQGEIAMQNLRFGQLDLEASVRELTVIDQNRQDVQVNADLTLTGTTDQPVVRGRVVVDEAIYRLPERTRKDVIDLDEAVVYVDIPGAVARDTLERSPSLWTRTRLDLEVEVTDDAILQSSNARIEIAGDLSLLKPAGSSMPTLSGTLEVRRGFYEEFGRRFTIEGGNVFFYGTPEINPGLHVVATRTIEGVEGVGDVQVRVTVGGTVRNPTIDLTSTPAFDKSEIISLALFGTPNPSAGQESEFQQTIYDLAGTAFTSQLTAELAQELNLDLLEVAQREQPTGDIATLFRIGKFISPDVYVTFEQEVGGAIDRNLLALRYQITDVFTVQASAGTGRSREETEGVEAGVDLFWEFTY
ncbi:MAG: translocation/assembly module TamB domain-containing protein [Gemmatimonadetes bacterium]|nr:translocation/assembly module TamB domain-containing protein [Gemmatimonadota bacterium]